MNRTPSSNYEPDPTERFFDLLSALLLMFAMVAAALRLSATDWAKHLEVTQGVVFWSMLLGLALGKSTYSPRAAFLFCLDYGLIIIPWQLGLLLFSPKVEWKERLLSMAGRIWQVFGEISRREEVTDNMLFLVLMAILFWILSAYAGYILVRKAGIWRAVVPMGIAALVIETFDPILARRGWFLAIYLFLSLLLVARTGYLVNAKRWRDNKTHVPSDASYDQTRVAVGVVLVLVLISWNMPALSGDFPVLSAFYRNRVDPIRQKIADQMSFMFSSLRESVGLVYDFYSDQMILGSGSVLTDKIEMSVEAPGFVYMGQRFYWRARVYDTYKEGSWQTSITDKQAYIPNVPIILPDSPARLQAIFKFRPQQAILTLYAAGQPMIFSRAGELQAEVNLDGSIDMVALKATPYIRPGEVYEVTASLPSFTEIDLRSAGSDYPSWVTERYLQLPDDITPRTLELAKSLTQGQDNPYDIAKVITNHLRNQIEYVETMDRSPGRQETIDWFLFDYKKGFCNYYATAEVVLLRSLGIPARLAVGYAQGEGTQVEADPAQSREDRLDAGNENSLVSYTVRQRDAHAWPEVFFPGLGWVEFEPTASQVPIFRPSGVPISLEPLDEEVPDILPDNIPRDFQDESLDEASQSDKPDGKLNPIMIGLGLMGTGIAVGLLGLALFARQRHLPIWAAVVRKFRVEITPLPVRLERSMRRLGLRPPDVLVRRARYHLLPELSKAYVEIDRALTRLGKLPSPAQTPAERAADLVQVLPIVTTAIGQLVREYQLGTYSTYQGNASLAQQASVVIRRQSRIALMRNTLERLVYPIKRRFRIRGSNGW